MRKSTNSLESIKNVIILSMVKYYNDMNIVTFLDNISINTSRKKDKIITVLDKDNNYSIYVNYRLSILNKLEYLVSDINYIFNNKNNNKDNLKDLINILQTEEIIRIVFKLVRLYDIPYLDDLNE